MLGPLGKIVPKAPVLSSYQKKKKKKENGENAASGWRRQSDFRVGLGEIVENCMGKLGKSVAC